MTAAAERLRCKTQSKLHKAAFLRANRLEERVKLLLVVRAGGLSFLALQRTQPCAQNLRARVVHRQAVAQCQQRQRRLVLRVARAKGARSAQCHLQPLPRELPVGVCHLPDHVCVQQPAAAEHRRHACVEQARGRLVDKVGEARVGPVLLLASGAAVDEAKGGAPVPRELAKGATHAVGLPLVRHVEVL
eukprot:4319094-Prymnesium_polylepis.2